MATKARFEHVEAALFDADQLIHTTADVRSVGELLLDADQNARTLLMDVSGDDAAALLRGWPHLITAAADLWEALPARMVDGSPQPHMDRIRATATSIGSSLSRGGWPGAGHHDPRLQQIADTYDQAADLVRRYGAEVPLGRRTARDDLDAALARVMHGVYVSTHAVSVALLERGRDQVNDTRETSHPVPLAQTHTAYAVGVMAGWVQRLGTAERTAGDYLTGRIPATLEGQAPIIAEDPGRLGRALTAWEIQAHRTLAAEPTAADIHLVARTQTFITGATHVLLNAAATHTGITLPTDAERLLSAVDAAGATWKNIAGRWAEMTMPTTRHDIDLLRASAEARAATLELTNDKTTLASSAAIAARPGFEHAVAAVLRALPAGADLAHVVAEQAAQPGWTGRARALSIRAHNDVEAGRAPAHSLADDRAWVSPADIHAKREIPLPAPVAEALRGTCDRLVDAAVHAGRISDTERPEAAATQRATARTEPPPPPRAEQRPTVRR